MGVDLSEQKQMLIYNLCIINYNLIQICIFETLN